MHLTVAAYLRGQYPVHETPQIALAVGPEHEMKVIGHKAIGQDAHRDSFTGGGEELHEGRIIGILVKDPGAGVTAIDDVVTHPSHRGPGRAWNGRRLKSMSPS